MSGGPSEESVQSHSPTTLSSKWWFLIVLRAVLLTAFAVSVVIPQIPGVVTGVLYLPTVLVGLFAIPAFYFDAKQIWIDDGITWNPSAILFLLVGLVVWGIGDYYYLYTRHTKLKHIS